MHPAEATFLITGGGSGLGAAAASELTGAGARVVVADLEDRQLAATRFVETDVTSEEQVLAAVEAAEAEGNLRGLVCCAGVAPAQRILGRHGPHDMESFRTAVEVNLLGTFNALRLAARAISENELDEEGERGVIVLTASIAAFEGQVGQAAYAASKGGVASLVLPAARELADHGVRVAAIAPGVFDTPMLSGLPDQARRSLEAQIPFPRRLGAPEEYAALVRHIVENSMINGEVIRLDGALRMGPR